MDFKFQKDNVEIIKKAIDPKIANFVYNYFTIKKQVYDTHLEVNYVSPFNKDWGNYSDPQAPKTYSHYSDIAMETLLLLCQPIMEEKTGLELSPTYSYARLYKKGDVLERHKDRFSCEISTTMFLGGDKWPIFIEPYKNIGPTSQGYPGRSDNKGYSVDLDPGDMLVYKGNILEHWREKFEGNDCAQVFLHYNNKATEGWEKNVYDGRRHLGLGNFFKRNELFPPYEK
jgi:hypothetical protein